MGELFLAVLVLGPPLVSVVATNGGGYMGREILPIFFSWIASAAVGIGVGWLTSLLVPLYLPVFTGLAAYWYAYYRMEENFRDALKKF